MEPVTALGIAAAAAQFIDFGLKTLALCKQIRDSETNTTEYQTELQRSLNRLNGIKKAVKVDKYPSDTSRALKQTVQDCSSAADDLQNLLSEIQNVAKKKPFGVPRAAMRFLKDQKKIEKLQNKLEKCQERFNAAVNADTRDKVLQLLKAQGNMTGTIEHTLLPKLQRMDLESSKAHGTTHSKLGALESQQQRASDAILQGQGEIRQHIQGEFDDVKTYAETSALHQSFLEGLMFPEMFARHRSIPPPSLSTYEWIFTGDETDKTWWNEDDRARDRKIRGSFVSWLHGADHIFWINGKAGSGKSNLMSFIECDRRTKEALKIWAAGRPLHVFNFFFWRAGSELQKSIAGMLQSLLYQLCQNKPSVIESVIANDSATRLPGAWNEFRLLQALQIALPFYQDERIFCLIDGLDEFEGSYDKVLGTLFNIRHTSGVKLCLSSRRENALKKALDPFPSLRLEDINYGDIKIFVRKQFVACGDSFDDRLMEDIARRAEGIFLWAVLVCKSLVKGHNANDDKDMLQERLKIIPSGLKDMFSYIFSNLDEVHRHHLSVYFCLLKWGSELDQDISVALVSAVLREQTPTSLNSFVDECRTWEDRIVAQCQGLIEIKASHYREDSAKWAMRDMATGDIRRDFLRETELSVKQDYASSVLSWIHRSAYDCIIGDSKDGSISWLAAVDERVLAHRCFEAAQWIVQFVPTSLSSNPYSIFETFGTHMSTFMGLAKLNKVDSSEDLYRRFDMLYATIYASIYDEDRPGRFNPMLAEHFKQARSSDGEEKQAQSSMATHFWMLTASPMIDFWTSSPSGFDDYIVSRFELIKHHAHALSTCAWTLRMTVKVEEQFESRLQMVNLLQERSRGKKHFAMLVHGLFGRPDIVTWVGNEDEDVETAVWGISRCLRKEELVKDGLWANAFWSMVNTWQIFHCEVAKCEQASNPSRALPLQLMLPLSITAMEHEIVSRGSTPSCIRIMTLDTPVWSDAGDVVDELLVSRRDCRVTACFDLSVQSTERILTYSITGFLKFGKLELRGQTADYDQCLEIVKGELWANDGEQLDAWQQLYLLTCVKKWFSKWWTIREPPVQEIPDENEEDGGDRGVQGVLRPISLIDDDSDDVEDVEED